MSQASTIEKLIDICIEANKKGLLVEPPPSILDGFSGNRLVGTIQRFTRYFSEQGNDSYVEIGVFQGLTLLGNAYANLGTRCFGIDNFSLFNEGGVNKKIVEQRMEALNVGNAILLDMDFEEGLSKLDEIFSAEEKVGVFFVDGAHDYRSQLVPLLRIKQHLAKNGVIIIDDANYPHVRQATADFLQSASDFALLCEAYTPAHPANLSGEKKAEVLEGWWNGVNVLVHDPEHFLPRDLPPLSPGARDLYFITHDLFRNRYAELSWEVLKHIEVCVGSEPGVEEQREKIRQMLMGHQAKYPDRYDHQNTLSSALKPFKVALVGRS